ncbi:MAG: 3-deoxy-D-manno-octulosonic acid transferase [Lysobacteraceae bacterium]|nr:MAG: 3-deoxy-D-manno-octulosonic acid transferase [Xanthomonadaceae bacterium]
MQADLFERVTERILRGLYSAALYLLLPITVYHLIWRGLRQRAYLLRWDERYAIYRDDARGQDAVVGSASGTHLWVHAVSVGEVNAAAPLVNALLREYPQMPVLVTTITPTGSERVRALWGMRVSHVYLPYDLPGAVGRFIARYQPRIALVVETELWPNLLFACRDCGIPSYLVNARLSERSLRGYRVLRPLVARALRTLRKVASQSDADASRFQRLGARADQIVVCGNLKFDIPLDPAIAQFARDFRARIGERPVWIAASTHPDEEPMVIEIDRHLRARWPDLLLLWAPRHPERFRAATQFALDAGLQVATRKLTRLPDAADAVFVVDTLGELMMFYACADVAFVGGSLQPVGGHNLLEPAATGTPIVTGPHLHNFSDIAEQMLRAHALRVGVDAQAVTADIERLLTEPQTRAMMAAAGRALVDQGRGALQRTLALIGGEIDEYCG